MKKIIISLLMALCLLSAAIQAQPGVHFVNLKDWKAVQQLAERERKNIFVDVYTTWCGPCKMMDAQVYTNEKLAAYIDSNFVAIKIQMDNTDKDSEHVVSWRDDAASIGRLAKVSAYPTMLFFNSKGELLYKMIGYRDAGSLLASAQFANSPGRENYRNDMIAYQDGERNYDKIPDLIRATRDLAMDLELANKMVREYKDKYLDKLPESELLSKKNLEFINENGGPLLVRTEDPYFNVAYKRPSAIDTVLGPGTAESYVSGAINEHIKSKIYKDNKPVLPAPDWSSLNKHLKTKFRKAPIEMLMLQQKASYYRAINDWDTYTKLKSEVLAKYPPKNEGMNIFYGYNAPAWDAFLNCTDTASLRRALKWAEKSIEISGQDGVTVQYMDTKANLLYKLGHVQEAISAEREAIQFSREDAKRNNAKEIPFLQEFEENIRKMQNAQPTWKQ